MTKTIAYMRVSMQSQDVKSQRYSILDYAQKNDIKIDEEISVQISSRRNTKERGIDQLLDKATKGDLILVSELSRLGRSAGQVLTIINELTKREIRLIAIKESIKLDGKQDITTKCMISMISLFAELERDLISMRTKEALAEVKASGKKLGRQKGTIMPSKLDGRVEEIKSYLSKRVSISSLARILGVSRFVLDNFMKSRKIIK
jgi:DNA invertase Pin-like site-specific DNA recombinase